MSRLYTVDPALANGQAAQLFTAIKEAVGMVPNAFVAIGSNSPVALKAALDLDSALRKSSLSSVQVEAIKLAVSAHAGCDYCVAAHTAIGGHAGLSHATMRSLRASGASGDPSIDALVNFATRVATTTGTVPADDVAAVKAAGYTDAQVVDTLLAVASITFTNLVNRVNDTVIDFPAVN
ncbi:carboxymuconolactone decarboxylase family protein [Telluria aromaticivorans]|uniref:Carboxymuconolactone decarboxylase family protein n=1 Tax=Telluria aromaticivorans TaxID=2725995 RepID=A0A7Y2JW40_9BURK|nr:carboxymuconolactone decarboxylase family protein [Telluria aromaticivorans]NNG21468.1 carboxymuconolactone decarboxylase family protein [Telluria aromaticivorans]